MSKARKLVNLTYPVIAKSWNKILTGKSYWKNIVLPTVLCASSILGYTKQEIEKLQQIEDSVYRTILGAPQYAQVLPLRGEIGPSQWKAQENESNKLLRRIIEEMSSKGEDYCIQYSVYEG